MVFLRYLLTFGSPRSLCSLQYRGDAHASHAFCMKPGGKRLPVSRTLAQGLQFV